MKIVEIKIKSFMITFFVHVMIGTAFIAVGL